VAHVSVRAAGSAHRKTQVRWKKSLFFFSTLSLLCPLNMYNAHTHLYNIIRIVCVCVRCHRTGKLSADWNDRVIRARAKDIQPTRTTTTCTTCVLAADCGVHVSRTRLLLAGHSKRSPAESV